MVISNQLSLLEFILLFIAKFELKLNILKNNSVLYILSSDTSL